MNPEKIVNFIEFLSVFASVKRGTKIKGKNDFENDAEHSYQVALVTWYIVDALKLKVNKQLILEYALVHDLVETYAGDTKNFDKKTHSDSKHEREHEAKLKIKEKFLDFGSLYNCIEKYELLNDKESKIVYIIDKILPHINIYLTNDEYYKNYEATEADYEKWFMSKLDKANIQDSEFLDLVNKIRQFLKGKIVFYK